MSRVEDKMKAKELQKLKQKQKAAATPGYNELDDISRLDFVPNISGAFGRSRPLCINDSEAGAKFLPCRTTLYPPSSSSIPKVSNAAPSSNLVMEHVYGYRGSDARDNARCGGAFHLLRHFACSALSLLNLHSGGATLTRSYIMREQSLSSTM
jgi:hypothetical protein